MDAQQADVRKRLRPYLRFIVISVVLWTAFLAGSLAWNIHREGQHSRVLATNDARASFTRENAFSFWADSHGEVAPLINRKPSPSTGESVPLMNPNFILRQVKGKNSEVQSIKGKITSFKLFNPENAPDAWETEALKAFERGEEEVLGFGEIDGTMHLRAMRPLFIEEICLTCHGQQGYKVGDIRGGVAVYVPMGIYLAEEQRSINTQFVFHGSIWILGITSILAVGWRNRQSAQERILAENEIHAMNVEIRKSREQLRLILDSTGEAIYGVDLEGSCTFCNPACLKILGYEDEEDLLGKTVHDMMHHSHADGSPYPKTECHIYRAFRKGDGTQMDDEVFWRRDGTSFRVEYHSVPITKDGNPIGAVVAFQDITKRKQAEEELATKTEELERSNNELQHFAYVVSHDLQEPLRMVSSYMGLLEGRYSGQLDKNADEYIGFAVDGAKRMNQLIKDLLDYSRVQTSGGELVPVNAGEVMEGAVVNLRAAISESGAEVTSGDLPQVMGDFGQLVRLLQNLVGNAIKYRSDDQRPKVGIDAKREGDMWVFSVADNGIGIEAENFEKIFLVFKRLHGLRQYEGTGIGLAVSKRIVERHNGHIWLESKPGKGSTFFFTLRADMGDA